MHIFTKKMEQVYHKKINSNTNIYVWKVTWELDKFKYIYSVEETKKLKLSSYNSEKRKVEVLAVHFILNKLLKKRVYLEHLSSGKPFIKENSHLSISHSHGYIAISMGGRNIAVDIEKPSVKLLKLTERFLSKKEKKDFDLNPSKELACRLWGAKESILKCEGDKNINFRYSINLDWNKQMKGNTLKGSYFIYHHTIGEMILTWSVNKDEI